MLGSLHFIRPWWLLALIPGMCWLVYYYRIQISTRCRQQQLFRWHKFSISNKLRWLIPPILFFCTVVIILSGPAWEKEASTVSVSPTVIVVDNTKPFINIDATLREIIRRLSPNAIGIIVYSGSAHVLSPLTTDKATLHYLIQAISPDIMPVKGFRPELAMEKAFELLRAHQLRSHHQHGHILWLTNSALNIAQLAAIKRKCKKQNIELTLVSSLDADISRQLKSEVQKYHSSVSAIHAPGTAWKECGHYLLPLALIAFLLMCRKRMVMFTILLSVFCISNDTTPAYANSSRQIIQAAEQAWTRKDYTQAAWYFGQLHTPEGYYNQGNAFAKNHQFKEAISAYDKVLSLAPDHQDARYNQCIVRRLLTQLHANRQLNTKRLYEYKNTPPLVNAAQPGTNDLKVFLKRKFSIELYGQQHKSERKL